MIVAGMKTQWGRYDVDHVRLMYTDTQTNVGVDMMIKSYEDPTIDTFIKHSDEAAKHIAMWELVNV